MSNLLANFKSYLDSSELESDQRYYPRDEEKLDGLCGKYWKLSRRMLAGLENLPLPFMIRSSQYGPIQKMITRGCKSNREANRLAYKAYLLFETAGNVKYFMAAQTRLTGMETSPAGFMRLIVFPPASTWDKVEFRSWGRAFVQHSIDSVNTIFPSAGQVMKPVKKEGNRVSLYATKFNYAAMALDGTETGVKLGQLFSLAQRFGKEDDETERAMKAYLNNTKKPHVVWPEQVPDISIKGDAFDMPDTVFRKLDKDDPRILFVGDYTKCCERVTNLKDSLERNVTEAIHSDMYGYYVVERDGEILAHSFGWRGTKGEMVFDGFESDPEQFDKAQYVRLLKAINLFFESEQPRGIDEVLVGSCADHLDINYPRPHPDNPQKIMPQRMVGKLGMPTERYNYVL